MELSDDRLLKIISEIGSYIIFGILLNSKNWGTVLSKMNLLPLPSTYVNIFSPHIPKKREEI